MSTLKRVAIVGPLPPPAGGMANQTRKLGEFLTEEGLDVDIVQVNPAYFPAFIGKIPIIRAGFRLVQYLVSLKRQLKHVDVVHIMANSGWSWHLFAAPAIWVAHGLNKPVVLNYRGGYAQTFFEKSWFWVKPSLRKCQQILVPSAFLQQVFHQFELQAEVVPNVLDQTKFYPAEQKTVNEQPHIIVTRNLEEIYDVATAIKGFALVHQQFPQARLSVAGTGPELTNLQALVKRLAIESQVSFVGRLSPDEIADLYRSADVMVNTSIVDNSPNSIIESLACGTPVVSTNVGGIPTLVTDQHDAILVNIENEQAIADGVIKLLQDDAFRVTLIENGQKTISKFFWKNVWSNLQQHYVKAIAEKG
ncbi:glycosyltransferase family 4 protein [Thalassotalea sp. 1_MG-2023]|uniref:glycosyltransferase family 4 protein n=1 Tax=Thalassotalea sp. 1_MG-2023 TaxID=3062680 RepID=UPI0026E31186|nr:glycosyltransferase family 4 protein [Thalassotalea sp. 1_MG-2023]MDO6425489.1 glycosyltransferase family 4 protein [Thalassotalea sp. 1_MG-2023]